jgi:predicted exporter
MTPRSRRRLIAIICWLAGLLACLFIIGRSSISTDMSAFLPASPTAEQQVLLDQLQDGVVSRLMLVGIEGGDAATRSELSRNLASRLRQSPHFTSISNGEAASSEADQAFIFENRYLLSAAVTPQRFSVDGLRDAIADSIDLLASPAGMLIKPVLPRDPTTEIMQLLDQVTAGNQPAMQGGVWVSRDALRALLLVQTSSSGSDLDAQQKVMATIEQAFKESVQQQGGAALAAEVVMTGPGVFAVQSRGTIEQEVSQLALISTALIAALLLLIYRSLPVLALGLVPMLSGALVGVAAVSLGFGVVHGVTLGFGAALIGEAVDYAIYLFMQSRPASSASNGETTAPTWSPQSWPAIRIGVLTSVAGFSTLLLSDFPGLAQLGLYAIAGLVTAVLVTRFVLPHLLPARFAVRDVSALGERLVGLQQRAAILRWPIVALTIAATAVVWQHRDSLWNSELASLSPVPESAQALDASLRADLGAPDVRYMVVVSGSDQQAVLRTSEKVAEQLRGLVQQGHLAGFQSPSHYLPSIATQQERQASLPEPNELKGRLEQAVTTLPVKAGHFAPFIGDVQVAKQHPPLTRTALDGTSLALLVDSLLFERNGRWNAVLPLMAPKQNPEIDAGMVRAALAEAEQSGALFVDLKAESDKLYGGYLEEAIVLSCAGLAGIVLLLLFSLRSPAKVVFIMLPLLAAALVVVAALVMAGQQLIILHLIGLLLIFAVGSNYALLFSQELDADNAPRTYASLLFANLTTTVGFGILAFSSVPVLNAIGTTVGPGAILSLIFSAAFAGALRKK